MITPIPDPEPTTLLDAVLNLSGNVVALTERLDVSVKQQSQQRLLTRVVIALMVVGALVASTLFTGLWLEVQANSANAVQQCENANDRGGANLALWSFILDVAEQGKTPSEVSNTEKIRTYVTILFAPRDCNDLSKHYELPKPPSLQPTG